MSDALQALEELSRHFAALHELTTSGRARSIPPASARPVARTIAKIYFEDVRPELDAVKSRQGLVDEIDFAIQSLLQLAGVSGEKQAYIGQLNELRPNLMEGTVDLMKARGNARLVLSHTERGILSTLTALLPATASSYEQALRDIAQGGRVSWRGTAGELREVLRDVIDHLAPDEKVAGAAGFNMERDQTRPTQKQKVRFILKARRSGSPAVAVAEESLATVENSVAALARSTYQRGSTSTHTAASNKEIKSLKRYVDALLAELLEVS
jgi:hypothetical protein